MTAKWVLEYFTAPDTWTPLVGKLNSIVEELNGHEEANITLPNTADNRALVAANKTVRISYDSNVIFTGQLAALDYSSTRLKCVLYNECYETMKRKTITADYSMGEAADDILAAICAAAGVSAGSCPSTSVAVKFVEAECFAAAVFLAETLNTDYSASGTTFTIAARGEAESVTNYQVKNRGIDRSKKRDLVRVRGVDAGGLSIVGEAGEGSDVKVFIEKKASDVTTLNTLAAKYLAELNTESTGAPIVVPINESYGFSPGDTLTVTNATYNLDGTYKMRRITKTATRSTVELDVAKKSLEQMIVDFNKYRDLGIYAIEPNQLTPWALNLQGLFGLYHLNEGTGTTAKDSSGTDPANDGTIDTGFWVDGNIPGTKVLNFDATGYVDCGDGFDVGGLEAASLGIWISPEDHFADSNYMLCKDGQIALQHYSTDDKIRFGVYIDEEWQWVTSDANISLLYGRTFAVGVYDGTNLLLYIDGKLHKSAARTGETAELDASSAHLFIGAKTAASGNFHGVMAEAMAWKRSLCAQEVQELYFFPLTRVVKKAGGSAPASGWDLAITAYEGGSTDPDGAQHVDSGEGIEVEATVDSGYSFVGWELDGVLTTTDNPYTVPAQTDGTVHSLVAVVYKGEFHNEWMCDMRIIPADATTDDNWYRCCSFSPANILKAKGNSVTYIEALDNPSGTPAATAINAVHPSNSTSTYRSAYGNSVMGQGDTVACVAFYVKKVSTPTAVFRAAIYAHTGTFGSGGPTGDALATSTNTIDAADISADAAHWEYFLFDDYELEADTPYVVVMYCESASDITTGKYVSIYNQATKNHPGCYCRYSVGAWVVTSTVNLMFKLYSVYEDDGADIVLTIYPATEYGYVLTRNTAGSIVFDDIKNVGWDDINTPYLTKQVTLPAQEENTMHFLEVAVRKGWAFYCDGTCYVIDNSGEPEYGSTLSGGTRGFIANIGAKPAGKRYQWYKSSTYNVFEDGDKVGTDSTSYSCPAQTDGEIVFIHVQFNDV